MSSDPIILKLVSSNKCFEGTQRVYEHYSNELKCSMKFAVYLPKNFEAKQNLPVLIWLSGLTCNEQNFITKSGKFYNLVFLLLFIIIIITMFNHFPGFHRYANEHQIIVVCPDTSPRDCNIEGEADRWDFGIGAGFYVDATEPKWSNHFRMFSYVNYELHEVIKKNFTDGNGDLKVSIFGHSMGGHGALISFLKNSTKYRSVSAFAPICSPLNCAWGQLAFKGYLGENQDHWKEYDASELVKTYNGPSSVILIDQGVEDQFLKDKQLCPEILLNALDEEKSSLKIDLRMQAGYDHSYYFISSFIHDHFEFHATHLKK